MFLNHRWYWRRFGIYLNFRLLWEIKHGKFKTLEIHQCKTWRCYFVIFRKENLQWIDKINICCCDVLRSTRMIFFRSGILIKFLILIGRITDTKDDRLLFLFSFDKKKLHSICFWNTKNINVKWYSNNKQFKPLQ